MPTFFNEAALTDEQKARWPACLLEYERVLESNLERSFARLSQQDRADLAKTYAVETDAQLKEHMRGFTRLMANSPGHSKSALFHRLLEGKAALPLPPPTSYSYPWYAVAEEAGPHRARVHVFRESGAFLAAINQCRWSITSRNEAAQQLIELDAVLQVTAKNDDPKDRFSVTYVWTPSLIQRVRDAYANGPEFVVQHGEWPPYRLFVSQFDGQGHCHHANKKHARKVLQSESRPGPRVGSVFDLELLHFNARIGKTLSQGRHPQTTLDEARRRYAEIMDAKEGQSLEGNLLRAAVDQDMARLEADVREFELRPDSNDWVELFMDFWYLERVSP